MKSKIFIYVFASAFLLVFFTGAIALEEKGIKVRVDSRFLEKGLEKELMIHCKNLQEAFDKGDFNKMGELMEAGMTTLVSPEYKKIRGKDAIVGFWKEIKSKNEGAKLKTVPANIYITDIIGPKNDFNYVALIVWEYHIIHKEKEGAVSNQTLLGFSLRCHLDNCSWSPCIN